MRGIRRGGLVMALLTGALLTGTLVAGCTTTVAGQPVAGGKASDRALVESYYADLNESAKEGPRAQGDFLAQTQHPDYGDELCDLGDLTLSIWPAMTTFRPDDGWSPDQRGDPPAGKIYVMGVSITIRQGGATLGEQIASQRVVVLDGKAYGFAPCPTGR